MSHVVVALYKFVNLDDYRALREPLLEHCRALGLKGSLLLAHEGINGTVAGDRSGIDGLLAWLRRDPRLADLDWKESQAPAQPFQRMKVKLKREIVTLGVDGVDPNQVVGTYVAPRDWNAVLQDPDVLVVDTRNGYEVAIGSFEGAINPETESFRDFPEWAATHIDPQRHKKVAMFCTGGIRCEKASSYLRQQGVDTVYHLRGGILKYLEEVPEADSLWRGECFVFDDRVAVGHGLRPGAHGMCHGCGHPVSPAERESPLYEQGVSCPHCHHRLSDGQRGRFRERERQRRLAAARDQDA